jgi:hypothetical protein
VVSTQSRSALPMLDLLCILVLAGLVVLEWRR